MGGTHSKTFFYMGDKKMKLELLRKAFEAYNSPLPSEDVCKYLLKNAKEPELLELVNKILCFEAFMHRSIELSDVKRWFRDNKIMENNI